MPPPHAFLFIKIKCVDRGSKRAEIILNDKNISSKNYEVFCFADNKRVVPNYISIFFLFFLLLFLPLLLRTFTILRLEVNAEKTKYAIMSGDKYIGKET
jgi:hypothetical protein